MIFEKPLSKPISNWNISDDVLLFLEEVNSTEVWMVKLHESKSPVLYKFIMPEFNMDKKVNSVYDEKLGNYIIPKE